MQLEIPLTPDPGNADQVGWLSGRPWQISEPIAAETIDRLRREVPLMEPVSERMLYLLAGRSLTSRRDLESFFYPSLDHLSDPFQLVEMDKAVARTLRAVRNGEAVAVHGDFDVDGITGCAVLHLLLTHLEVEGRRARPLPPFIPDRALDGYGVAAHMVRHWAAAGVTLLITVDTGSAALAELELARQLGIDVIVLDHHIFEERPCAVALVNPRRPDARYPNPDLCGVAVAFKLAQALQQDRPESLPPGFLESLTDLVALGLVADQMSLTGENRVLVRKGLARLADRQKIRPGLSALLRVSGLDRGFPVTATDLAYQVAPRLNACGRIGRVMAALELLLTDDPVQAEKLAQEADRTNTRRKQADLMLKEEAIEMAKPYVDRGDPGLVLHSHAWHKGVIGIGAARLVELYQLPTILIAEEGDEARGSARSVANVDVKAVLDRCAGYLVRYGGHSQAAGLTLRRRDIRAFREAFLTALRRMPGHGPLPVAYDLDLPLDELSTQDITKLVRELDKMEPFGAGNPKPVFRSAGLRLRHLPAAMGGGAHLRFGFRGAGHGRNGAPALNREFVAFGAGEAWRRGLARLQEQSREPLDIAWDVLFQVGVSNFRPRGGGYDPVQQLLVDIRPAAIP
ncbi:MAG: single-stranded-DNA-specific exonuclease RecJ [Candidatus Krumholzibacteria bacterium]|nr:single-stranded-DNA-specific exonuclease RecJ [Candidatus Krumholzibacteria bacterium]